MSIHVSMPLQREEQIRAHCGVPGRAGGQEDVGLSSRFELISLETACRLRLYRGQFSPKPGGWLANATWFSCSNLCVSSRPSICG